MTADQIERKIEQKTDRLDALLMSGAFSQAEYDHAMKNLNDWAELQYSYHEAEERARSKAETLDYMSKQFGG